MVTYSNGSVTKCRGKWMGQIWATDESGKRTRKSKMLKEQDGSNIPCDGNSNRGRNRAMAALSRWRADLIAEDERRGNGREDTHDIDGMTVSEYLGRYLATLESSHSVEKSTLLTYRSTERRIDAALGDVPVADLTREQVQDWVKAMGEEDGLAPRTVIKSFRTLHQCLNDGVKNGPLRSNPCDGVKMPKHDREQPSSLTKKQATDLLATLEAMPQTRVVCAARVSLLSGLRIGEICALKWRDVDFQRHILNVNKAVAEGPGGSYIKGTKNRFSVRKVSMIPQLEAAFKARKEAVLSEVKIKPSPKQLGDAFVLGHLDGNVIAPPGVSREWAQLRKLLGVVDSEGRPLKFHGLRHTHATLAIQAGVDVKSLSASLGHSSAAMTLDIYASSDEQARRAAADKFGEFMGEAERHGQVMQFRKAE